METVINATTIDAQSETIEGWFYVEIFGHTVTAGRLTTRKLGTQIMFQIDVPLGEAEFSHSELYSPASVFSMKPTTEEWCRDFSRTRMSYEHPVLPYIPKPRQLAAQGTHESDSPQLDDDDTEDDGYYEDDGEDSPPLPGTPADVGL